MNGLAPLRGAGVFAAPPEVSAIAATSGYCLPTLRVEEHGSWGGRRRLSAEGETFCQTRRQSGVEDFFLRTRDVVFKAAEFNGAFIDIKHDVGGLGIVIARLPDCADVDEIFFAGLDL